MPRKDQDEGNLILNPLKVMKFAESRTKKRGLSYEETKSTNGQINRMLRFSIKVGQTRNILLDPRSENTPRIGRFLASDWFDRGKN